MRKGWDGGLVDVGDKVIKRELERNFMKRLRPDPTNGLRFQTGCCART